MGRGPATAILEAPRLPEGFRLLRAAAILEAPIRLRGFVS